MTDYQRYLMVSQVSNLTWPIAIEFIRAVFSLHRALKENSLAITACILHLHLGEADTMFEWMKKNINEERDKRPAKIMHKICVRRGSDLL